MLCGASIGIREVRKFLEKQNLRITCIRYNRARFKHTNSCLMVVGRSVRSFCVGRQTALEKVATFLLEIDRRLEQPEVMVLPMERQSIADYLGMTFETVCRVLSSLQEERILSLTEPRHRGIVLHDRSKLAQRDGRRIVSPKPSQAAHRPTSDSTRPASHSIGPGSSWRQWNSD